MQSRQAQQAFEVFAAERGVMLSQLTAEAAVDLMLAFYQAVRADDVAMNADGDMLLFQWGVYDWGHGASFTYNITRQLIFPHGDSQQDVEQAEHTEDDEDEYTMAIYQLSLTLNYTPTDVLYAITPGNRWCSHRGELTEFKEYIKGADATRLVQRSTPVDVALRFNDVC